MRLLVSSNRYVADVYGPATLLLGQWCVASDVTGSVVASGATILDHPWANNERLLGDYERIREIYDCALEKLARHLASIHGVNLSTRGWEILLGPWLRVFINCVFERFMLLESAVTQHGATTLVHGDARVRREADNTSRFIAGLQKPAWNEMLCADIARLAFPALQLEAAELLSSSSHAGREGIARPRSPKMKIKDHVLTVLKGVDALTQRHKRIFLHRTGMPWQTELSFMIRAGMLPHFFLPGLDQVGGGLDSDLRKLEPDLGSHQVALVAAALIGDYLPRVFVEDFAAAKALVERKYPKHPTRIVTGVSYYVDDCFKLFTALSLEKGAEYVIVQHGGAFGAAELNDEEELMLKTADYFLSWGWTGPDNGSARAVVIPTSSLMLSVVRDTQSDPTGGIIMPVCEWTLQTFRLYSAPLSFRQLDYIDELVNFHRHLTKPAGDLLRLRLQPNNRGWHLQERLCQAGLGAAIMRAPGRFVSDLPSSRLAVVNSNSTTMLETFALNFPTVLLLDRRLWPVRPEVQRDYDELSDAGILYKDPVSAAAHVSKIYANPAAWWFNEPVQQARRRFVDRFARRDTRLARHLRQWVTASVAASPSPKAGAWI